ncbi:hypothetical protein GUJ93_ZPchr0012g21181 [Zizania palustris]|uniref:Uncharacterized protein n=1 Tax=Zizania palustris TaxID=103762 RepID=A0A8J6BPH3_ZIZPA|nr:hypothetical protein GUJ93_ZPchr0012g21181 [Zizania palustris]
MGKNPCPYPIPAGTVYPRVYSFTREQKNSNVMQTIQSSKTYIPDCDADDGVGLADGVGLGGRQRGARWRSVWVSGARWRRDRGRSSNGGAGLDGRRCWLDVAGSGSMIGGAGSASGGAGSTAGGVGSTADDAGSASGDAGSASGGAGSTSGGAGSTAGGVGSASGGAGSMAGGAGSTAGGASSMAGNGGTAAEGIHGREQDGTWDFGRFMGEWVTAG